MTQLLSLMFIYIYYNFIFLHLFEYYNCESWLVGGLNSVLSNQIYQPKLQRVVL